MKETKFIEQNKHKWGKFENSVGSKKGDPSKLGEQFNEITDDLSYARTFYKRRSVRVYLNQVAQGVFASLYKQKREGFSKFGHFWKVSLPLDIYYSRKNMLLALVMFILWTLAGAVSQAYDVEFARIILGDGYVDATIERIKNGNPLGIYGEGNSTESFFAITENNIRVSFLAFVSGVFLTLGTHLIMLNNGIMLGSFQYWFKTKGLFLTSFLGIWIHGAFEISAIVIASGAGITLGNSILFPGHYTRMQSFMIGARRGIKIMISLVPVFIIAGFLESYVTQNYNVLAAWAKLVIIILSFAIIIFYYGIYPFIVARKYPEKVDVDKYFQPYTERKTPFYKLRKPTEIFNDGFTYYRQGFSRISRPLFYFVLPLMLAYAGYLIWKSPNLFNQEYAWFGNLYTLFGFGPERRSYTTLLIWTLLLSLLISTTFFIFHSKEKKEFSWGDYFKFLATRIWFYIPFAGIGMVMFGLFTYGLFIDDLVTFFMASIGFVLLLPFFYLIPVAIGIEKSENPFSAIGKGIRAGAKTWWKSIGVFGMITVGLFFFWFVIANPLADLNEIPDILDFFGELIETVILPLTNKPQTFITGFYSFVYLIFFTFLIPLAYVVFSFHFFSAEEEMNSKGLWEDLEKFGKRKRNIESELDFE